MPHLSGRLQTIDFGTEVTLATKPDPETLFFAIAFAPIALSISAVTMWLALHLWQIAYLLFLTVPVCLTYMIVQPFQEKATRLEEVVIEALQRGAAQIYVLTVKKGRR